MRAALGLLVVCGALALGLYLRATAAGEPVALRVGPTTTVISEPRDAKGGIDFDAAMAASPQSEQRLDQLLELVRRDTDETVKCAPLASELRAKLTTLFGQPLRLMRPASHVTPTSEQLVPALLWLVRRMSCSCPKQPETAAASASLLAAMSAHFSSSNQETFYLLHPLAAHAATECFKAAPGAARELASMHFYDVNEHLELVRLGMLEEVVRRTEAQDVNAALEAFNEDFMHAVDGAPLADTVPPETDYLASAAANRAAKSAYLGRSFARQIPELVAAARAAHDNTVNERRAWSGE